MKLLTEALEQAVKTDGLVGLEVKEDAYISNIKEFEIVEGHLFVRGLLRGSEDSLINMRVSDIQAIYLSETDTFAQINIAGQKRAREERFKRFGISESNGALSQDEVEAIMKGGEH